MPDANQVVAYGQGLVGRMTWLNGNAGLNADDQMHLLASNPAGFCDITTESLFNCWEAVFAIGYCSNPDDSPAKDAARDAIVATDFVDFDYYPLMVGLLQYEGSPVWDQDAQPGDVVFLFGMSHVAVCTGGENVLSLWCDPNGDWHLQQTTIPALWDTITGNVSYYLASVNQGLQDNPETPDYGEVYDAVHDLMEQEEEEPGSVTPQDVTDLLERFGLVGQPGFCVQRQTNPFAAY